MVNKSFRPTQEDVFVLQKLIRNDSRVERSASEALFFAFRDAAKNPPNWNQVKRMKFKDGDIDAQAAYGGATMSFTVDERDFAVVLQSIREQLGIDRVRISFMARLCVRAALMRLHEVDEERKAFSKDEEINRMDRLAKYMELLQKAGKSMNPELDSIHGQIVKLIKQLN